jgi:hypothetical protein
MKLGETLEDHVRASRKFGLRLTIGKPALHDKARAALRSLLNSSGKKAVDPARIWGSGCQTGRFDRQELAVKPVSILPYLPRNETVRPPEKLEMIIVEDMRSSLKIELR